MKNMTRQIAAILLAATVSAGALTACGGPQGGAGETEPEEAVISGTVNRLGDYLVLLTEDENYQVFDFGEGVDADDLMEGDRVQVRYTGDLDSEDPAPVAVAVEKQQPDGE